jgi:hypothetical protein
MSRKRRRSLNVALTMAPRDVHYLCGLCNESYVGTTACNPWWSLTRQECPLCHRQQVSLNVIVFRAFIAFMALQCNVTICVAFKAFTGSWHTDFGHIARCRC